jgi:hypothetical protein
LSLLVFGSLSRCFHWLLVCSFMYVYCHLALMIVQGSLFPLILGCSRESIPFAFLFSKLILLMVCSRESVSFAWVCLYIFTAGLQLVFFFFYLYNSYIW